MKRSETHELMSFFRHQHSWNDLEKERPIFTASLLTIPVGQDIPGKLLSSRACFRLPVWTKLILDLGTKKFLTFTQQNNCPANLDHLTWPCETCHLNRIAIKATKPTMRIEEYSRTTKYPKRKG